MNPRIYSFVGGAIGEWSVTSTSAIAGDSLAAVARINVVQRFVESDPSGAGWTLRGATSNARYTNLVEKKRLVEQQAPLGRPTANFAALIPIRKSAAWWDMTQDERRSIFEERSRHIEVGLAYLPSIARRLHHCRDLSDLEPFDFLTFFDYAEEDEPAFDHMLTILRASDEWRFVEREVDIRLVRDRAV